MNCGQAVAAPKLTKARTTSATLPTEVGAIEASSQLAGERRVVTVLFADISGFTAMSENMDPEQLRSLMNDCFDRLVPIVEKYEGTVDKFIGDEIMALFGAPTAHEDDPARALRVALEFMDTLAQFNAEYGTDLGMHAGINTGLVVAGGIGSQGRQQYSVMGDTVNLASRLESASERGEIFVGPDTHRATAPLFEFETLSPIQVKGKADPVQVYKLLGSKREPDQVRGLVGLESPMVGRDPELKALLKLSSALQSGQGSVATIIGEAGLGKSRLSKEWRASARSKIENNTSVTWIEGRCLSYGQGLAYHLVTDMLYTLIGVPPASDEAQTRIALWDFIEAHFGADTLEVYPYLGHMLSLQIEGEARDRIQRLDPQSLQNYYFSSLRQLFQKVATQNPVGFIFEDTHWADPSSTDLIIKLMPLTNEIPLLFCFVTRPDYDAPGWKLVTTARDTFSHSLTELNLQTLSTTDSRQIISNLLEIESLPEEIRNVILARSEGNPFFVEEVIRMLIDRGAIIKEGHRWIACEQINGVEIPDNLQGLLLARIDRLPEDIKHTLRVASVIGRQFSVKVLEEVLQGA
ncbi:MAG: adenylate/guanylate cyclase domain-containing protein [Chloroflexota bacterium]